MQVSGPQGATAVERLGGTLPPHPWKKVGVLRLSGAGKGHGREKRICREGTWSLVSVCGTAASPLLASSPAFTCCDCLLISINMNSVVGWGGL